ncbi:MAG: hypothetical protein M1134_02675 [Actinobacteria bacterium]|nr:hypothetical protein [Actinomycetota bacterium]
MNAETTRERLGADPTRRRSATTSHSSSSLSAPGGFLQNNSDGIAAYSLPAGWPTS